MREEEGAVMRELTRFVWPACVLGVGTLRGGEAWNLVEQRVAQGRGRVGLEAAEERGMVRCLVVLA